MEVWNWERFEFEKKKENYAMTRKRIPSMLDSMTQKKENG